MNGVIALNKPKGKTSHDMVYFVRRLLQIRRVGHTGTLDPDATGVLPICIGNATKASSYIMDSPKRYTAQMLLGSRTDTQDASGTVLATAPVQVTEQELRAACGHFTGTVEQTPPMYSAVKVGGKKLYELAREGKTVERKRRAVTVYSIGILDCDLERGVVTLDILCSKGTYIRTLCDDIGLYLGCYAHMGEMVRTQSGGFTLAECYTPEALTKLFESGKGARAFINTEDIFSGYEKIFLNAADTRRVKNGVPLRNRNLPEETFYRLYDENGGFLCVSKQTQGILRMQTSFWTD